MSRNYEWENEKYKRLVAKVDKNIAEEFLNKINMPYAVWLKGKIQEE